LFARDAVERELNEELRFHVEMEAEKNVRAGMSPAEARRAALLSLGGIDRTVESHRDARGARVVEDFIADVRYAARALGRTPGFVVVSILTLAVAMSIGTLGFTGANAFLYRPLPVPDGAQLISVFTSDWSDRDRPGASSYADVVDFARAVEPVADVAGESRIMLAIGSGDEVSFVQSAVVSSKYFRVVRVKPLLGQCPVAADIPAIVISHSLWRRAFASDTSIVGRRVGVNGQPFVVAAVTPEDFRGISRENGVDAWIAGAFTPMVLLNRDLIERRGYRSFRVAARLRDGASLEALNARLSLVAAQLFQSYPADWRDTTGGGRVVTAMREQDAHRASIPAAERLLLIAGVIGFGLGLVIVACTNLASMQMARGASRRREIATRLALGAGRGRIVRQLLAECALLAVPGIAVGIVVTLVVSALMSHYRPIPLPSWDLAPDRRSLAFIAGALAVTLLVFGLLPALQAVRADVLTDLKGGDQPGPKGLRIGGMRGGLIVTQVALSMAFTGVAGLVALGLVRHANEGRGEARSLLVTRVNFLPGSGDSSHVESTFREVTDAIRAIPGVEGVSASIFVPVRGARVTTLAETKSASGEVKRRELDANYVRPGYFGLVGTPLLRGRDFEKRDFTGADAVVVSKAMADALWPGEDPMGQRVKIGDRDATAEVVGVVGDPPGGERATERSYPGTLYLPLAMYREAEVVLHVRAAKGQATIATQVAGVLRRYSTQLVAPKPITLDEYYDNMLLPLRLISEGAMALAALQCLLALAGLSGLVAYVTALRRQEIGIRTALGAGRASILRLVMRQGVRLTAIGAAIGLAVSVLVAQNVATSLPITLSTVVLGLVASGFVFGIVGAIAMIVPAWRALRVAPSVALRVD
jgi:predicted permease